jgi:phage shock protein PspC (stress-responsive transcriptional regulator)
MKRTFTANIDGQVFHIDEDAYRLLQEYLDQLRLVFGSEEGPEIVADIETRIREHFSERIAGGCEVIVLADVNKVISTIGRPEELNGAGGDKGEDSAGAALPPPAPVAEPQRPARKKLFRSMQNKLLGGVFGGIALYLGWNANIMRLLFALLACFTYVWPCILLYLFAWMIIPPATTVADRLKSEGLPVNPQTLGQNMAAQPAANDNEPGFWTTLFGFVIKVLMSLVGLVAVICAIASLVGFAAVATGLIAFLCVDSVGILDAFGFPLHPFAGLAVAAALVWLAFALVISMALCWVSSTVVFRTKSAGRGGAITIAVLSLVLLCAGVILSIAAF